MLQRIENRAYRSILQVPNYTAVEFLRGEIGASSMESRSIKGKILYLKHALQGPNGLLKEIITVELEREETRWMKDVSSYMGSLGINKSYIENNTIAELKRVVNKWETKIWIQGMSNKSTLQIYRMYKKEVKEEKWFRNGEKWSVMLKARSNTLKLRWREWATQENKKCGLCDGDVETLEHFLIICPKLQEERSKYVELQMPREENTNTTIATILLFREDKNPAYYIDMLWNLWIARRKLYRSIEE